MSEPLFINATEFPVILNRRESRIDAVQKFRVSLFHGNTEIFRRERHRERLDVPFSRLGDVVVVRRNVVDDGVYAAVSELKVTHV